MKVVVIAHPNAKQPRIEAELSQTLHVYVKEPSRQGKANQAIIRALARHFSTSKSNIRIVRGEKSKNKILEVNQNQIPVKKL